ncbi:SusD/RagB family nutrient-binding outer membrane lipoprotein [Chitinophaga agrisoli]|uniref:SusD/RagB family nutrient-binding outer membrane lipoprotein n=1 Tax=Chitinophaga agrisoli TaxID=2607653 RepID=A0A5B2VUM7_9BACT|nr:SusD/RagB family nutrient-binding outer membrane lipoprotein [Chitinophaga agrisoli]KAA2242951.1 SusD/RagB family nutrient-binding outer membrane lipoprotein [Chitinophaga agrisoli]
MKKLLLYIIIAATGISACKKDLEDRYYNQDQLRGGTSDIVPGLFTQLITTNKIFVQDYGEWFYLLSGGTSITGYEQVTNRYISYRYDWFSTYNDLTSGNGFDDYPITSQAYFESSYTRLKNWETIKGELDKRSGQDKQDAELYFKLATLVKLYQSAKLVDLFNSIPYFNAFEGGSGSTDHYFPAYDNPKEIYTSIIADLGELVNTLGAAYDQTSELGKSTFRTQDVAFKGDINKWIAFANATRLKLLVRISGVDEAYAKPLITETLTKPLPTQDLTWQLWYKIDPTGGGFWLRGLYETTYAAFIPNIIMKRMNYGDLTYNEGIDDPRLPVLALPTKYNDYRGISYNIDAQTPIYDGGDTYYPYADDITSSLGQNAKSMYNHATFQQNANMPVYMFSLAELDLLLAEIAQKGLAATGKTAGEHIKDAVVHSVDFWYMINQLSVYERGTADSVLYPAKPAANVISAWGDKISAKFNTAADLDGKMEILMQQKYIHLNLLHPYELWAELRRTRHPKLEPFTWRGSVWKPMPERVRYPTAEQSANPDNFQKVADQNNLTTPIFWVPTALRSVVPYWNDYNYE